MRNPVEAARARTAFKAVQDWVEEFECRYSRFREDSILSQLNRGAGKGWQAIDDETSEMLELCDWVHYQSMGCVDVTAAPLVRLYYKASAAPDLSEVARSIKNVGWRRIEHRKGAIRIPSGMSLDFGSWGKEYAVDFAAAIIQESGFDTYLVNFGNDIRVSGAPDGTPGWVIGMEDPLDTTRVLKRLVQTSGGVAASGNYRRKVTIDGQTFGHIVDPRTGRPAASEVIATHVTANTTLLAGILSTAAIILGRDEGLKLVDTCEGAEALMIGENFLTKTKGMTCYDP